MRVLAIDPGKTTGLALYQNGPGEPEWQAWASPWQDAMTQVRSWVQYGGIDDVVCEMFVISQRTLTQGKDAHWPIGGRMFAQYWCEVEAVPFTLQTPADAKGFVTKEKLELLGWRTPGPDHADDATRHLVLRLVRLGAIDPRRLVVQ